MTVNDLLKRIDKADYDKVLVLSDSIGWTNISGKISVYNDSICLFPDDNEIFSDDK